MLTFANKYGYNVFSQNGENGIIDECLKRLKLPHVVAVEFGAPSREYCSNINHLTDATLHFFDINPDDPRVTKAEITPENVNEVIPKCNVLSIDIDGNDLVVWSNYKGRPDIVIIEINSSLPPMIDHFSVERGSSYISMLGLGLQKGYFLLCHTGNMIFVLNEHREKFTEIEGDGIKNYLDYFNDSWL